MTRRKKTTAKRSSTPRRRSRKASTPMRRTTRRVSRNRGMLSEFFDPKSAQAGAMVTLEGAVVGVGAHFLGKILPTTMSSQYKGAITLGAGFATAVLFKRPNLGAGMAGVGAVDLLRSVGFLAEDNDTNWANDMDSLPMVLNANDSMYLSASPYDLSENPYLLSEESEFDSPGYGYEVGYFPEFGGI